MSNTKVKLPSIKELTSHSVLPQIGADGLPLLLIFRGPAPSSKHLPTASAPAVSTPVLYQYYSYGLNMSPPPPMYQNSYYQPVYYQLAMVQNGYMPQASPVNNVPEVINKPMNKCHRCGTTETPEWRRGPNGLRTLCNACGLFHAKLVKRKGAALAAEEVLYNKVCKGKNGRRVLIKKQATEELKKKLRGARVTDIPPIAYPGDMERPVPHMVHSEYLYSQVPRPEGLALLGHYGQRVALPPPVWSSPYQQKLM